MTLIHGDALQLDLGSLVESMAMQAAPPPGAPGACIRVLANLPYNITQPFLERILPLGGQLASATLLLQEEAAERLVSARPGDVDWRGANLLLQYYSRPSIRYGLRERGRIRRTWRSAHRRQCPGSGPTGCMGGAGSYSVRVGHAARVAWPLLSEVCLQPQFLQEAKMQHLHKPLSRFA